MTSCTTEDFPLQLLEQARQGATRRRQAFCSSEQLLESLLLGQGLEDAAAPVTAYLDARKRLPFDPPVVELTRSLREQVLPAAEARAVGGGARAVAPGDLLAALLDPSSPIARDLRHAVRERLTRPPAQQRVASDCPGADRRDPGEGNCVTPLEPSEDDAFLVERVELVDRILLTLMFSNPVLVGPPRSGRHSLIRLLVGRFAARRVPRALGSCRLHELDPTRLLAGTTYRGELEDRIQRTLRRLESEDGTPILVVEDLPLLVGAGGGQAGVDVASALVPYLKRGSIKLVGTASHEHVRERLEGHPGLLHCATLVPVEPPDAGEARRLLARLPERLRLRLGVEVAEGAIDRAIALCSEHVPHVALPGSAERLLQGAAAAVAFGASVTDDVANPLVVEDRALRQALSVQHRIPQEHLDRRIADKIHGLDRAFHEQVFGQDHVFAAVHASVKVALMHLADPRRPRGRMFFVGPPGTGKTECARLLARYLMGSEDALLRFDMSEYQERSAISTLLGSDKGLVNSDEGGRLTEPLRQNPHRVILFDEIEKAHPSIFHIFLQILDNALIHDKRGCAVSFGHALCIFTSNVGCDGGADLHGRSRAEIVERLAALFRPEFLDRIETFVPFRALDREARRRIAGYQLERLRRQLVLTHRVDLSWTEHVLDLACEQPDREPGARHVLRWVQSEVKPALVDVLLDAPEGSEGGVVAMDCADASGLRLDWRRSEVVERAAS